MNSSGAWAVRIAIAVMLVAAPCSGATSPREVGLQLGNRVFFDTNANGVRDPDELAGPSAITLLLTNSVGAVLYKDALSGTLSTDPSSGELVSTQTDSQGRYAFSGLPAGTYAVRIPESQFVLTGSLFGYVSSPDIASGNDRDNGLGVKPALGSAAPLISGGILSATRTLADGAAPLSETDGALPADALVVSDSQSDTTLDIGVYKIVLGGAVWDDGNNDGLKTSDEGALRASNGEPYGATVVLKDRSGNVIATTTADERSGQYRFTGIAAGDYLVEATLPDAGYRSATGNGARGSRNGPTEPAPSASDFVSGRDDGNDAPGGLAAVRSGVFSLQPGLAQSSAGEQRSDQATGVTTNLTIDLGAFRSYAIGGALWIDQNANGLWDTGEPTLPEGVRLELLGGTGNAVLRSAATDRNGRYVFDGLPAGQYRVRALAPNWVASPLHGGDGGSGSAVRANRASVDGSGALSTVIVVGGGATLPLGERGADGIADQLAGVPDSQTHLSVDFGLIEPPSVPTLADWSWAWLTLCMVWVGARRWRVSPSRSPVRAVR